MDRTFGDVVEKAARSIERALARISAQDDIEGQLHALRGHVVELLALIERNPGIEAAADDLYTAAQLFVVAQRANATFNNRARLRPLQDALMRFQERITTTQPSGFAKEIGLR